MKMFNYLALVLLIMAGINSTACAQPEMNLSEEQKEAMQKELEVYATELGLSESQKPEFKNITVEYFSALKELKDGTQSRREKYKTMRSLKAEKNDQMKNLLSKEQYKVYKEHEKKQDEKMKERIKAQKG